MMIFKGGFRFGFSTNLSECQLSNTKICIVKNEYQLALATKFHFVHSELEKWQETEDTGSEIDAQFVT
jgi:hypothetical protein